MEGRGGGGGGEGGLDLRGCGGEGAGGGGGINVGEGVGFVGDEGHGGWCGGLQGWQGGLLGLVDLVRGEGGWKLRGDFRMVKLVGIELILWKAVEEQFLLQSRAKPCSAILRVLRAPP